MGSILIAVIVLSLALLIGILVSQAPSTPPLIEATVRNSISHIRAAFQNDPNACSKRDWNNNTALHFAAKTGSIELIDELIQPQSSDASKLIGCDVNAINAANTSVLHWAVASKADNPAVIRHLLQIQHSIKQPTKQSSLLYHLNARNESVLHWAVEWKSHQIVDDLLKLIKSAIDSSNQSPVRPLIDLINQPDENGDSPMHRLTIDCATDRACQSIATSLIRAGANLTAENHSHRTPLQRITFDQAFNQSISQTVDQLKHSADEFRRNLTDQFHTV